MVAKHLVIGLGVVAVSATSSAALAAEAATAKPVAAYAIGNRASTTLKKKKSHLQEVGDTTTLSDGRYVVLGLGTLVVLGGVIIAIDNDDDADNFRADSPGG